MTRRLTVDDFVSRSIIAHGDKYDYSLSEYFNQSKKLKVVCKKHGEFLIAPANHMRGQGCNRCGAKKRAKSKTITHQEVIAKFVERHGDRYIYDKTKYVGMRKKLTITCRTHGDFEQLPPEHLKGNCKRCSASTVTEQEFLERALAVHNGRYSYKDCGFTQTSRNVVVTCQAHGEFEIVANSHLKGHGCRECASHTRVGWSISRYVNFCEEHYGGMSHLYVVKMEKPGESFFKVGIASGGVEKRFKFERNRYQITKILEVAGPAAIICRAERAMINRFKSSRIDWKIDMKSGSTECFTEICMTEVSRILEDHGIKQGANI